MPAGRFQSPHEEPFGLCYFACLSDGPLQAVRLQTKLRGLDIDGLARARPHERLIRPDQLPRLTASTRPGRARVPNPQQVQQPKLHNV